MVLENPEGSLAWKEPPMVSVRSLPGMGAGRAHMCHYEKKRLDTKKYVRKRSKLVGTN